MRNQAHSKRLFHTFKQPSLSTSLSSSSPEPVIAWSRGLVRYKLSRVALGTRIPRFQTNDRETSRSFHSKNPGPKKLQKSLILVFFIINLDNHVNIFAYKFQILPKKWTRRDRYAWNIKSINRHWFCNLMVLFWINVMKEQTQKNKHRNYFLNICIQKTH